jgi:hypothetical protein
VGVTADTPVNIVIGAGDVYVDGDLIGATMANNVFRVVREIFTPDLNGVPGPLEGTDYIRSETAEMEVTIPELSADILELLIPNSTTTPSGGDVTVTSSGVRRISSASYHEWELRVPGIDNLEFRFRLHKAIATGPVQFEAADDGVLAPRMTIQGRWEAGDNSSSPWEILRLLAGS